MARRTGTPPTSAFFVGMRSRTGPCLRCCVPAVDGVFTACSFAGVGCDGCADGEEKPRPGGTRLRVLINPLFFAVGFIFCLLRCVRTGLRYWAARFAEPCLAGLRRLYLVQCGRK